MMNYLAKNYLGAVLQTTTVNERFHPRIKEEFLQRIGNSRIGSSVDLLIKSVENMADSMEVREHRRFDDSAHRRNEAHKRNRTAVELHKRNSDMIVQLSVCEWRIVVVRKYLK
ncbi:hypothetical protein Q1695_006300 [Nippostrongylus brasiliensis]|nr:hypothetical protein Q1695_006300 [Nippostrongylus brasiliensis]